MVRIPTSRCTIAKTDGQLDDYMRLFIRLHVHSSSVVEEAAADYYQVLERYSRPVSRSKGCPDFAVPPRSHWVCTSTVRAVL